MFRKLLPLVLALAGLGIGVAAGFLLRPAPEPAPDAAATGDTGPDDNPGTATMTADETPEDPPEYVKLANQFVVPVVEDGHVVAMVVLSLNLEVGPGQTDATYAREPKLRDAFLQVLLDHANAGGFRGSFTDAANLVLLRRALQETAAKVAGDLVRDVLIVEIVRQDS